MTPKKLQLLIEKGEGLTVEFKKTTAQLHAAFETICAFLNSKGGVVLIGVANNGKAVGQNITEACLESNIPLPEFEVDDIEFKVTFRFPHSITTEIAKLDNQSIRLSPLQKKILEILNNEGFLPLKGIAAKLPQMLAERTLRHEMFKLRALGLVASKGLTKSTVWLIDDSAIAYAE